MKTSNRKAMIIMLIILAILFVLIFGIKMIHGFITARKMASAKNISVTVSSTQAKFEDWQSYLTASASMRAIRGVYVTTELAAKVDRILFKPGQYVKEGDLLVELNTDADVAQLYSIEANTDLAQIIYRRDRAQYIIHAVSKATLDTDWGNFRSLKAQVAEQKATIQKKIINAPFSGRLGINLINPGQYVNPGDRVVTLQTLDPIYADFYLPQQNLSQLAVGQKVSLTTNSFPSVTFKGKITTINPEVDTSTRNVEVEATLSNPSDKLLPGMFGQVNVIAGKKQRFITLPQAAISYNPYGDLVYIIKSTPVKKGSPELTVTEQFVTVGETRGDQIAVLSGVKAGQLIVTSGQLKLRNGSRVVIDNSIVPSNNPAPQVAEE